MKRLSFGQRIASARERKGWTQEEVAQLLGTSAAAVSRWENDNTNITLANAERLALVLGLDRKQFVLEAFINMVNKSRAVEKDRLARKYSDYENVVEVIESDRWWLNIEGE